MKVLILGGYGVFGGRLAELLSDIAEIELVIWPQSAPRRGILRKLLRAA